MSNRRDERDEDQDDAFWDMENTLSLLFHNLTLEIDLDSSISAGTSPTTLTGTLQDADVNSVDPQGRTPLHLAAELDRNSLEYTKDLLRRCADIEAKDKNNLTPVYYAAKSRNWDTCKMLLARGAQVKADISREKVVQNILTASYRNKYIRKDYYKSIQFEINWPIFSIYNEDYNIVRQNTILHLAIQCKLVDCVEMLIRKGAEAEVYNSKNVTPLHLVVIHHSGANQKDLIDLLIRNNANINSRDCEGKTPLHKAVEKISKETVKLLLQKGASINEQDKKGMSPLHYAVQLDSDEIAEELLRQGADMSSRNRKKETPLHCATSLERLLNVKLLLKHGVEVDVLDGNNITPFLIAAAKGNPEIMHLLVESGANVNARDENGRTALLMNIIKKDTEIVKYLLDKGADVNIRDAKGILPIRYAVSQACPDVVKLLIEAKTEINETLLKIAVKKNQKDTVELLVNELRSIQEDTDDNAKNDEDTVEKGKKRAATDPYEDCNVLLLALSHASDDIVTLLIENGTDVVTEIYNGFSPVQCAQSLHRENLVSAMIEKGADKEQFEDEEGQTLLHRVASGKRMRALPTVKKWMCELTKNTLIQDNEGNTPLHIACGKGRASVIRYLAKNGDKKCLTIENNDKLTPLDIAKKYNRTSVIKFLQDLT